jgi:hypothetical protein
MAKKNHYSKYFDFELTPTQSVAFASLVKFAHNPDQKVFILKGYAGTGKTTLMSGLVTYLDEQKKKFKLLATTGRAASILNEKIGLSMDQLKLRYPHLSTIELIDKYEYIKASTVHSHIYLFSDLSEDVDALVKRMENDKNHSEAAISLLFTQRVIDTDEREQEIIYIIDESSMLSDLAAKDLSTAQFGSGNLLMDLFAFHEKGKFLFIGDPCQLPPVGQIESPALSIKRIKNYYLTQKQLIEEKELKDIVRQSEKNGIIEASMKLRHLKENKPSGKWPKFPLLNNNSIDVLSEFDFLRTYIKKIINGNYFKATYICASNNACKNVNKEIRKVLFPNQNSSIVVGDLLLITQNNTCGLNNGDLVLVKEVGTKEWLCDLCFVTVVVQELNNGRSYPLKMIESLLLSGSSNIHSHEYSKLIIDFCKRMKSKGIKQGSMAFKNALREDLYVNALRAVYGYAITCHKAQGNEYDEVFIQLDNKAIGFFMNNLDPYQWMYTAITRAKERLYVLDNFTIH